MSNQKFNLEHARRHDMYIETRIVQWHEASELVKVYGNTCLHYNLCGAEAVKCVTYNTDLYSDIKTYRNISTMREFTMSEIASLKSHLDWVTSKDDIYNIRVEDTYRLAVTATRDLWADWARMERPCLYWP